jgi:hypothetical protein
MLKKLIPIALGILMAASVNAANAQVCDVTYSWESETMSGQDIGNGSVTFFAQPMSEVTFNHKAQMKVLDAMSKEQDAKSSDAKKNKQANANEEPMYRTDVTEYRVCDGGAKVKIADGSASIQGISYRGTVRIADEMLRQGKIITDHHRERANSGEKHAWDHDKARKVKRDDLGRKVKDKD